MIRFALLALVIAVGSQHQDKKPQAPQDNRQPDQRGTQNSPLVVKILPTAKTQEETDQERKDSEAKASNDRNLVNATYILGAIALLQLIVFGYQAYKLKQTVESAAEQSADMKKYIGEAERSANAMETIAEAIETGNKAIIRAYLTVTIGSALYQERGGVGQNDTRFEGRPTLVNNGNTPARRVRIQRAAQVLPNPLPPDFQFPLPEGGDEGDATVGARINYTINCIVKDFVPYSEVSAVKEGNGKCLYVWGRITYEDVFGDPHLTRFAQCLFWNPNNTVYGIYIPGQNDAD
jgi:hypothetical protein